LPPTEGGARPWHFGQITLRKNLAPKGNITIYGASNLVRPVWFKWGDLGHP